MTKEKSEEIIQRIANLDRLSQEIVIRYLGFLLDGKEVDDE